jgi:glycosyltransferase involved in cell wall biosynthesis
LSGTVVIAANSTWNIVNFRQGLIRALKAANYTPIVVAPFDATAEDRMQNLGVEYIPVDIERSGLNPFADLRLLLQYCRILKKLAPAAFLGFTIKPNIYGCIAARWLGIRSIANVSGLGTVFVKPGPLTTLIVRMYRLALSRAEVVFFQNRDDRQLFLERGIVGSEQTRLLPGSGIDLMHFVPVPLPPGPARFLLIGRLLGDKGVREFVEAARMLRESLPGARFQLLGPLDEGNRTAIGKAELDRWIAEDSIEYLGSAGDVRPFIEQASVVVLPTAYREGVPHALLEGAAMARPLITTDTPGCRDLVEEQVNGLLCTVGDSGSLAEAMKKLAKLSPEKLCSMGQAARTTVEERYSEELVVRAYLDALSVASRVAESDEPC